MRYIQLTEEERTLLETKKSERTSVPLRKRLECLLLSHSGLSVQTLSTYFRVVPKTIYKWFDLWEEKSISALLPQSGRGCKKKLASVDKDLILNLVRDSPRNLKPVLHHLAEQYQLVISKKTLQRFLKIYASEWRRVRKSLKSKRNALDFETKKQELETLKTLAENQYIDLFYYDESHFGLTTCVPYAWQEKGQTIELPTAKGRTINVAGFFSKNNQFFDYQSNTTIKTQQLIEIFEDFVHKTNKKTVVILDNAPIHKSKVFTLCRTRWESEHDVYLFFLPTYSPELNLIEILWRKIKFQWLNWTAYLNFEALQYELNTVLRNIGSKLNINFV